MSQGDAVAESEPKVIDNPGAGRFELLLGEQVGGFAQYRHTPSGLAITHAEVHPSLEGRGLGSVLAARALDAARAAGQPVLPYCSFIRGYIQRHPAYLDLVPAERRAEFRLPADPA